MARSASTQVGRTSVTPLPTSLSPDEVAQVAYQLFQQRGATHGCDQADWFKAEEIVRQRQRRSRTNGH